MGYCPRVNNEGKPTTGNFDQYAVGIANKDYTDFTNKQLKYNREFFIQTDNFFMVKITDIKEVKYKGLMYDFSIKDAKSFVGNGLLLHNSPFTAGAVGDPIIVTGLGGVLEYAKPENSYLINYSWTPVFGMNWSPWYNHGKDEAQMWAEPDCGHAIELMRHVYNNQEEAREKGKMLEKYIAENLSWEKVGQKIINVIKSL